MTTAAQIAVSTPETAQRGLDPLVRRLFVGVAFSALGSGLTMLLIGNELAHLWVACTVGGTALAAVLFLPSGGT